MSEKQLVAVYMIIGMLYLVVKFVFVTTGYLLPNGIELEAIPAVTTYVFGIWVLMTSDSRFKKSVQYRLMMFIPLALLLFMPLFTYQNQGDWWLSEGRLSILLLYELFALMQFVIAFRLKKAMTGRHPSTS